MQNARDKSMPSDYFESTECDVRTGDGHAEALRRLANKFKLVFQCPSAGHFCQRYRTRGEHESVIEWIQWTRQIDLLVFAERFPLHLLQVFSQARAVDVIIVSRLNVLFRFNYGCIYELMLRVKA